MNKFFLAMALIVFSSFSQAQVSNDPLNAEEFIGTGSDAGGANKYEACAQNVVVKLFSSSKFSRLNTIRNIQVTHRDDNQYEHVNMFSVPVSGIDGNDKTYSGDVFVYYTLNQDDTVKCWLTEDGRVWPALDFSMDFKDGDRETNTINPRAFHSGCARKMLNGGNTDERCK